MCFFESLSEFLFGKTKVLKKVQKPLRTKMKEDKWLDPNRQYQYVNEAGIVMCKYCAPSLGKFKVTSNTVSLQDRNYVTVKDNNGKVNLDFPGACTHPSQQKPLVPPPPCKAVINTEEWENYSDTHINQWNALLLRSIIKCSVSQDYIRILFSGQKNYLEEVEPLFPPRPGHYYKEDGTFLGKISVNEDIYLTDETTFMILKNKKEVEEDKVIAFTELYGLNNKEVLDRANWAYGEGGGNFIETYAQTIENLKNSGKSGYGPKPFASEKQMYQETMLHGTPAKCLYPNYFTGDYKQPNAKAFADARKTKDQSGINSDPKKKAAVKAILDSKRGLLVNEGYNNWRGSGDELYTDAQKKTYSDNASNNRLADQKLIRDDNKKVYATVTTSIDHKWELSGNKYRRHSFYKIRRVNTNGIITEIEGIK